MPARETSPYVLTVDYPDGNQLEQPVAGERSLIRAATALAPLVPIDCTWWVRPTGIPPRSDP